MAKHNKIGATGEQLAADFLLNKGYLILQRNWRSGHREIDIIAAKDDMLIFIEIKTRSSYNTSFPEESVTHKKRQLLKLAAEAFAEANPKYRHIRFDIISILVNGDIAKEILHFEEAFH